MTTRTVSDCIVEFLEASQVEYVFGLPGSSILDLLDKLFNSSIRFINVRHEQTAAHMADAYGRLSGKPGVCLVSLGPGVTNLVSGIANAYHSHSPVVVIAGAAERRVMNRASFQEIDQLSLFRPITKLSSRIRTPSRVYQVMYTAFRTAMTPRQGPVFLDIPRDLFFEEATLTHEEVEEYLSQNPWKPAPCRPVQYAISKAAELITKADRAVIIAGQQVLLEEATTRLIGFVDKFRIPVAVAYGLNDAFPTTHPFSVGQLGRSGSIAAREVVSRSDCILALGTSLGHFTSYFSRDYIPRGCEIIHVSSDPNELGEHFPTSLSLLANITPLLDDLEVELDLLHYKGVSDQYLKHVQNARTQWLRSREEGGKLHEVPLKPSRIFYELRNGIPKGSIIVVGGGSLSSLSYNLLDFTEPGSCVAPLEFGCLGFGFPAGLGAKLAKPHQKVFVICGDGGFSMNLAELETALREEIKIVCIILNNYAWGSEKAYQKHFYPGRNIGTEFLSVPDFAEVARKFGAEGLRVESPEELKDAIQEAQNSERLCILEIIVDPEEFPPPARLSEEKLMRKSMNTI